MYKHLCMTLLSTYISNVHNIFSLVKYLDKLHILLLSESKSSKILRAQFHYNEFERKLFFIIKITV